MAKGHIGEVMRQPIWHCCLVYVLLLFQDSFCQDNPLFKDPSTYQYSLTSNSDCSDQLKNIFNFEAKVVGYLSNSIGGGPTDCTIRLTSQGQYQDTRLRIKIIAAELLDCTSTLSIYDGQDGNLLENFDCHTPDLQNRRNYYTSGDTVTIRFSRSNPNSYNYDVEIRVKSITDRGPDDDFPYHYFDKFSQEAIVGIIGGFYLLVLLICIAIVIYYNFKYQGRLKRWETHQLSTMKSGTTFDSRSQLTEPSNVWATGRTDTKDAPSYYSRSNAQSYSRRPRYGAPSDEGASNLQDHDEPFQRNLMNNRRDVTKYRASENTSFTGSEEDDPDNFVEKVIRPRVKTRPRESKNQRPPSFEEAISERSSQYTSEEEEEETASSGASSIRKKRLTSSEEATTSESGSETESEISESEDESRRRRHKKKQKWAPRKNRRRRQSSTDGETSSYRSGPRRRQPGGAAAAPPTAVPYAGYFPGQLVPVMAGHPGMQPVQRVPEYPPPHYPEETQPSQQPQIRPTDPPVYSYLVRRGYTPLDENTGRNSPASNNSSHRGPPEERETTLHSGVEYMSR